MNTNFTTPKIISVSMLNTYLKGILDSDPNLQYVFVSGEISNLTDHYASGHIYLSLKDSKAVIKAVMFSFNASRLRFKPQNGMKVIARGKVSIYEPSGQYQLYIEDMQPDGIGSLTLAFEQLKEKLSKEGLFDTSHKKSLPQFPKKVTVITSPTGAALQDIRNILSRRCHMLRLNFCLFLFRVRVRLLSLLKLLILFRRTMTQMLLLSVVAAVPWKTCGLLTAKI